MKQKEQVIRMIETNNAIVGLRSDGIVHVYYKPHTEITVELQDEMNAVFHDITSGKKSAFIFEAGENVTVNKEARDNAIRMEHSTPVHSTAVFVQNLAHKIISEFYYKFNKPVTPYKVVTEFQEGVDWLLDLEQEIAERNA